MCVCVCVCVCVCLSVCVCVLMEMNFRKLRKPFATETCSTTSRNRINPKQNTEASNYPTINGYDFKRCFTKRHRTGFVIRYPHTRANTKGITAMITDKLAIDQNLSSDHWPISWTTGRVVQFRGEHTAFVITHG